MEEAHVDAEASSIEGVTAAMPAVAERNRASRQREQVGAACGLRSFLEGLNYSGSE